jgi:hypothetical protein
MPLRDINRYSDRRDIKTTVDVQREMTRCPLRALCETNELPMQEMWH